MSSSTYVTRDEAIEREIISAIEGTGVATRDEYNIAGIADEVIELSYGYNGRQAYRVVIDVDFWAAVERHALEPAQR